MKFRKCLIIFHRKRKFVKLENFGWVRRRTDITNGAFVEDITPQVDFALHTYAYGYTYKRMCICVYMYVYLNV